MYNNVQTKGLGDFYAYCDVYNYHLDKIVKWDMGVALIQLGHNMLAIFNGHNNKAYIFSEVPEDWVEGQWRKCVAKYTCGKWIAEKLKNENESQLDKIVDYIRSLDY